MNGGTLNASGGDAYGWNAYELNNVTVGGSSASTITSNTSINGNNAILLSRAGTTTFNVGATGDATGDLKVSARLTNGNGVLGSLTKTGAGKMVLSAGNTYTGGTFINAGTLDLRGDQSYSSQYTIGNGARLNVTSSDGIWFYNAPSFNFTSSGNGNITADSGNFIMSANTSYTTAGGARNLIDGSRGINLNGYTATFDVVRGTDANTDLSVSTVLWNSGGMIKNGNGIMKMSGVNSYSGETKVLAGTLMVDTGGSIATSSATVSSGATLKVNGVAGAVVLNGILSGTGTVGALTMNAGSSLNPGDTIGKLTASSASFAAGSTYNFGIASVTGAAGTAADLFSVTGALDLSAISSSSKMNLVLQSLSLVGFNVDSQYSWTLAEAGSITGAGWAAGTDVTDRFIITSTGFYAGTQPGRGFNVKTASEGGLVKLVLNAVPEPTTGSLFFVGSMLWAMNRRRRS
jgi:autotransporter-associated beta strand protein